MTEPRALYSTVGETDAITRLVELLGANCIMQLANRLDELLDDTGYGNVTIVLVAGRVRLIKVERSYDTVK